MKRRPRAPRLPPSAAAFLLVALLVASRVEARSLSLQSHTLTTAGGLRPEFEASDARAQAVLYEILEVRAEDPTGFEAEVSGLAGIHLAERPLLDPAREGDRAFGNLVVGLLKWQSRRGTFAFALGRQYLFAGAGRAEHLDGLSLTYRSPWNVELSAFAGRTSPWQLDYAVADDADPSAEEWAFSNYAVGGTALFRLLEQAVGRVGFVHEAHGSETVRQALTFDAGYYRTRYLEALAGGSLDTVELLPHEVFVQLISRPIARLKLSADYTFQIPSLAIPKTSIFSVFTLEAFHDAALGADWGITERLTLGVEGGLRLFPDEGERLGYTVALSGRVALGEGWGRVAGLRVELLDAGEERLLQGRLYALYRLGFGLYGSADLYLLWMDSELAGGSRSVFAQRRQDHPLSLGGLALLGYAIVEGLTVQVGGGAFTTPAAAHDLRLLARVTYAGAWGTR